MLKTRIIYNTWIPMGILLYDEKFSQRLPLRFEILPHSSYLQGRLSEDSLKKLTKLVLLYVLHFMTM